MQLPEQPTIDYIAMSGEEIEAAWAEYYRLYDEYFASLEPRRRAHTRRNRIAGLDAAKRAANPTGDEYPLPMTKDGLAYEYGSYVLASRKKKGAGKGNKETYRWQWRDYRGYRNALRELFPREYGLMCCREEQSDFACDTWWNVPDYRDEAIRDYRGRVKAIRLEYGLTKSEVSEFMRVG